MTAKADSVGDWLRRTGGRLRRRAGPSGAAGAGPPGGGPAAAGLLAAAIGRARGLEEAARLLADEVHALLAIEFAAVTVVDADAGEASGVVARLGGADAAWWRELRLDLREEPSGIASAVFERAPVVVYDIASSPKVSARLAERTGAKSALWVPVLVEERVVAVVTAATVTTRRAFTTDDLSRLQALVDDAAPALDRLAAAEAVAAALERERAAAAIARKLRRAGSADELVRVAVRELREALRLDRVAVDVSGSRPEITHERAAPLTRGERQLVESVAAEIEGAIEAARRLAEARGKSGGKGGVVWAGEGGGW